MKTSADELARKLKLPKARGLEAVLKADLIDAIARKAKKAGLTHAQIAKASGLPRSAVTGILSGSLQRVTLDRILRLVEAVGLTAQIRVRETTSRRAA